MGKSVIGILFGEEVPAFHRLSLRVRSPLPPNAKRSSVFSIESIEQTTSLDEDCQTEDGITAFDIPAPGYTPEQFCSQHECERLLFAVTAGMNERLTLVWRLRTVEDLTLKEIAQALGLTLTAVKTRLFRARRELQKEWESKFVRHQAYCQEYSRTRSLGRRRVPSHSWFARAACTRVSACQPERGQAVRSRRKQQWKPIRAAAV